MAESSHEPWVCSVCGFHASIGSADRKYVAVDVVTSTGGDAGEGFETTTELIRCPNAACHQNHLRVGVWRGTARYRPNTASYAVTVNYDSDNFVGSRFFLPTSPRPLSAEVPDAVANDYKEAYLIRDLSPKASATLARRALQGMIRDFWKVSAPTLHAELKAIEAHCDPDLYAAMMQVKSVGNIGAHPEKDISIIVDIYPGEAEQLLELLHHLDQEWYVARRIKRERLAKLKALGEKKEDARTPAKAPGDQ